MEFSGARYTLACYRDEKLHKYEVHTNIGVRCRLYYAVIPPSISCAFIFAAGRVVRAFAYLHLAAALLENRSKASQRLQHAQPA